MKKHCLAIALLLLSLACGLLPGADHVYFPEWKVRRADPATLEQWDLAGAYRRNQGNARVDISLNGFWRFAFCESEQSAPPPFSEEWGYYLVPSFWRSGPKCNFFRTADGRAVDKIHGKDYDSFAQGWYYREFATPPEAEKSLLLLKFDALYSKGIVIVNGQNIPLPGHAAKLNMVTPACWVDITAALKPVGERNELFVATMPDGEGDLTRAGLQDNVWLSIRTRGNFGAPRISTFVDLRQMRIDFVHGTLPDGFRGTLELAVRDAQSNEVVHRASMPYAPSVTIDCITPKLWSVDEPNLYYLDCRLVAGGREVDQASIRFGFRELTTAGGKFLLNGKPLMINTDSSWQGMWAPLWQTTDNVTRKCIRLMKLFGINAVYSQRMNAASFYDIADEEGFLCVERCELSYDEFNNHTPAECAQLWRALAEENVVSGRLDNHPSLVAILINVYFQMSASGCNPAYIGMSRYATQYHKYLPDGQVELADGADPNFAGDPVKRAAKLEAVAQQVRDFFPDAEVLTGASAHVGNAYGVHIYHTWGAPWAELSALFSRYAREKDIPVYCGEYAVPYHGSYAHLNLWGRIRNQPEFYYWQENGARILGPAAYREKTIKTTFAWDGAHNDLLASSRGNDGMDDSREYCFLSDMYAKVLDASIERTIFFWRYDGLAGLAPFEYFSGRFLTAAFTCPPAPPWGNDLTRPGVKPAILWGSHVLPLFDIDSPSLDFRPNLVSTPFKAAMDRISMRIIGAGEDIYEDDHAFWGGEELRRAVGVVNMAGVDLDCEAEAVLLDGAGMVAARTAVPVAVSAYGNAQVPFALQTPMVSSRRDYTLKIVLKKRDGGETVKTAAQQITLFPAARPAVAAIGVFGGTAEFLDSLAKLGYDVKAVDALSADAIDASRVLVIAPGALSQCAEVPDFSDLAEKHGIRTLVMEQLDNASPELIKSRSRQVFINAPSHPILDGLQDSDFAEWRGSHSLLPAYGNAEPGHVWSNAQWTDWGNRGMVAGNVFRRPYCGSFLSLLVSGFDLYQTPLLEYRGKRAGWIGSQLEIGSRLGLDPVATTLFDRMVDYLATRGGAFGQVGFIGGDNGRALLERYGVEYAPVELSDPLDHLRLLIVSDPDWETLAAAALKLSDYVYNGGRILYLHTSEKWYGSWLPFLLQMGTVKDAEKAVRTCDGTGAWLEGWSECELYWRGNPELPAFTNFPKSSLSTSPAVMLQVAHGRGSYAFCTLSPQLFDAKKTQSAKIDRMLSALMVSHGAYLADSAAPYHIDHSLTIPLRNLKWEFSLDPENTGLAEKRQDGEDGTGKWLSGQQTLGGEFVRPGIGYEAFLERDYAGVSWYRLRFNLTPEQAAEKGMRLELGHVNATDHAYVNGVEVGSASEHRRVYDIPDGVLKPGSNVIAVRIERQKAPGGLVDAEVRLTNAGANNRFWKRLSEGDARDYDYNPDWIRQY